MGDDDNTNGSRREHEASPRSASGTPSAIVVEGISAQQNGTDMPYIHLQLKFTLACQVLPYDFGSDVSASNKHTAHTCDQEYDLACPFNIG